MKRIRNILIAFLASHLLLSVCSYIKNDVTQQTGQSIYPKLCRLTNPGMNYLEEWARVSVNLTKGSKEKHKNPEVIQKQTNLNLWRI